MNPWNVIQLITACFYYFYILIGCINNLNWFLRSLVNGTSSIRTMDMLYNIDNIIKTSSHCLSSSSFWETHLDMSSRVQHPTYSKGAERLWSLGAGPLAHLSLDPAHKVPERFGTGNDVEWCWERGPFFKVTHPQLRPSELPLDICMVLKPTLGHMKSTVDSWIIN